MKTVHTSLTENIYGDANEWSAQMEIALWQCNQLQMLQVANCLIKSGIVTIPQPKPLTVPTYPQQTIFYLLPKSEVKAFVKEHHHGTLIAVKEDCKHH